MKKMNNMKMTNIKMKEWKNERMKE